MAEAVRDATSRGSPMRAAPRGCRADGDSREPRIQATGSGVRRCERSVSTSNAVFPSLDTYIPPLSSGVYRYNLFVTKFVDEALSIPENQSSSIAIYPNPVGDQLNITLNQNNDNEFKIDIFDTLGQEVLAKKYTNTYRVDALEIDCKNLSSGFYFMQITSETQKHYFKFIKK